jgi:ATP-dependent DNA helicase PIF1
VKLHSKDQFSEVDDPRGILCRILTEDILNSCNKTQVPTHTLVFKVNDVCIVLRNLPALKLATNTRVRIVRIFTYLIVARTLNEPQERVVGIPRIRFKFRSHNGNSFQITRTQFPLRLAYAMTINKSQSQTLGKVLLDSTEPSFAHGHTYVALSRIRDVNNIRILIGSDKLHDHNGILVPTLTNIVYPEMVTL